MSKFVPKYIANNLFIQMKCLIPHEHDITFLLQSYETSFVIHIMHLNIKDGLCDIKIKGN